MEPLFNGIKNYLTNWKNLLLHTIVGVIILSIALFAPISPYIRLTFVVVVIAINVLRMKYLD